MRTYAILFLLCLGGAKIWAQTPQRVYIPTQMFWSDLSFGDKLGGKFRYQIDYRYRRSADIGSLQNGNHGNLFKNPFQQVVRPWIHYQLNDAVRLSLSPLGWWGTWYQNAGQTAFKPEFRICPQVSLSNKLGMVQIQQRYRYEFRFFGEKDNQNVGGWDAFGGYTHFFSRNTGNTKGRFRYFVSATLPLKINKEDKHFYLSVSNEFFLGVGKNTKNENLLDQNRTFASIGYKLTPDIRVELGYLKQVAFRFNNTNRNNVESNNLYQAILNIENVSTLFHKKT